MIVSNKGRKFIESWEALICKAYDDATEKPVPKGGKCIGTLTIGYGHTSAAGPPEVFPGMSITPQEADDILAVDLTQVETEVGHWIKVALHPNQFDALASFQFTDLATDDFALYNRSSGRVLRGLVRRRKAEADIFAKGVYVGADGEEIVDPVSDTPPPNRDTPASLLPDNELEGASNGNVGLSTPDR